MKIVVHDYAGHPFQVDLSRNLAKRGHTVYHLYFAGDQGLKHALNFSWDTNFSEVLKIYKSLYNGRK